MALAQDFDTMEENLRNALRHDSKYQPLKFGLNRPMHKSENDFSKNNDYITVYDSRQTETCQTVPSFSNVHRESQSEEPSFYANSPTKSQPEINYDNYSNLEEFKKYCSLLTDRIRRVEEQNHELLRIAEQQKTEYNRVVSQVVESEQSQRLLINECSNLRKQVQQLSYHNQMLRSQQESEISPNEHPFHNGPSRDCYDDARNKSSLNHGYDRAAEILKLLRRNPNSGVENAQVPNLSAVLDLFAAIQLVSQSPSVPLSPIRRRTSECSSNAVRKNSVNDSPSKTTDFNFPPLQPVLPHKSSSISEDIKTLNDEVHSPIDSLSEQSSSDDEITSFDFVVDHQSDEDHRRSQIQTDEDCIEMRKQDHRPASISLELELLNTTANTGYSDEITSFGPCPVSPKLSDSYDVTTFDDNEDMAVTNIKEEKRSLSGVDSPSSFYFPKSPEKTDFQIVSEEEDKILTDDIASRDHDMAPSTGFSQQVENKKNMIKETERNLLCKPGCDSENLTQIEGNQPTLDQDQNKDLQSIVSKQNHTQLDQQEKLEERRSSVCLRRDDSQKQVVPKDVETTAWKRKSFFMDQTVPSVDACFEEFIKSQDEELLDSEAFLDTGRDEFIFISSSPQTKSESSMQAREAKIERLKSPEKSKMQLRKKNISSKRLSKLEASKRFSFNDYPQAEFVNNKKRPELLQFEEAALDQENNIPRKRTFSEGSIEREKPLDKLTNRLNKHLEFRRQSSVGFGETAAYKSALAIPAVKQKLEKKSSNPTTRNLRRPRFPTTNPNSRLKLSFDEDKSDTKEQETLDNKENKDFKTENSDTSQTTSDSSELPRSSNVIVSELKHSKLKPSKRNKSPAIASEISRKPSSIAGPQPKSLVGLMKSKFSRSSSKLVNSGKKSSFENSKNFQKVTLEKSTFYVKDNAFSPLDSEYLPPGKDGDLIRKQTKQKQLNQKTNDVLEKRSSQNIKANVNDRAVKSRKASEELLSDEGFAEGSTIERSEKEDFSSSETVPNRKLPDDIESLRSKMFASTDLKSSNPKPDFGFPEKHVSASNNVASIQKSRDFHSSVDSISAQKSEPDYSKYPSPGNQVFDPLLGDDIGLKVDINNDVYVTGVTIVPSSSLNQVNHRLPPTSKLRQRKLQKPPLSSGAIGRFMKSMSNRHGGSKEDLSSSSRDVSLTPGKENKKNKLNEQRKDMEKAFMSSMVQAELAQSLTEKSSSESASSVASKHAVREKLSNGSTNGSESTGTRSSLSSIPSVSSTSSQGMEVDEATCFKHDLSEAGDKRMMMQVEKPMYGKSYGILNKSTSLDSNASTSDSETNFEVSKLLDLKKGKRSIPNNADVPKSTNQFTRQIPPNVADTKISSRISSSRIQAVSKNTKLAAPSKLLSGKNQSVQKRGLKLSEKSTVLSGQTPKTKLAPLGYGFGAKKASQSNFSMSDSKDTTPNQPKSNLKSAQSKLRSSSTQQPSRNINSALKPPIVPTPVKFSNNKITPPKARSNTSTSGLLRPRPIHPGMGAV